MLQNVCEATLLCKHSLWVSGLRELMVAVAYPGVT